MLLPLTLPIAYVDETQAGLVTPTRAHPADGGLDLKASRPAIVPARGVVTVPTGIRVALPVGTVGLVCSRSGLAARRHVFVLNAPGILDAGYRGEVQVILANHSDEDVTIDAGERIAQLVVLPVALPNPVVGDVDVDGDGRGSGGFGSTGRR